MVHPGVNHILQTGHKDFTDITVEHIRFLFTETLLNISVYSPIPCPLDDLRINMTNGIQMIAKRIDGEIWICRTSKSHYDLW